MSEHRYDIRISESCVDPNPLMVERQDPDNFTRFQSRERCALEIAAYVFKIAFCYLLVIPLSNVSILLQSSQFPVFSYFDGHFVTIATVKVKFTLVLLF